MKFRLQNRKVDIMLCPLCNAEMHKNPKVSPRNKHLSLKCPRCSFVIFYKGVESMKNLDPEPEPKEKK
ncbi:MAG TPA: hypothetical protein P5056_01310 [Candidatus Paceibacterota bacterium]|nr:hypothetical protein [Candidatus Paceibacterota bacterium]